MVMRVCGLIFLLICCASALMTLNEKEIIVVSAEETHTATVIWLHGLGDTGDGWASVAGKMRMPWAKFVFPTAPTVPVTINRGHEMPAWYDIALKPPDMTGEDSDHDVVGIEAGSNAVRDLIQREIDDGIPEDRIVLAGFSQGAVITIYTSLFYPGKLAGGIALSGYMPVPKLLTETFDPRIRPGYIPPPDPFAGPPPAILEMVPIMITPVITPPSTCEKDTPPGAKDAVSEEETGDTTGSDGGGWLSKLTGMLGMGDGATNDGVVGEESEPQDKSTVESCDGAQTEVNEADTAMTGEAVDSKPVEEEGDEVVLDDVEEAEGEDEVAAKGGSPPRTPLLLCHGAADRMVPVSMGQKAASLLGSWEVDVMYQEFAGLGHGANPEELTYVRKFLLNRLPQK